MSIYDLIHYSAKDLFDRKIRQPPPDAKLWRYMNFEKFISIIQRKSLFFAQLANLEDQFEGTIPFPQNRLESTVDIINEFEKELYYSPLGYRFNTTVSCWSINEHESSLMWNSYAGHFGIAIQTTVNQLCESLFATQFKLYFGQVNYGSIHFSEEESGGFFTEYINAFYKGKEYKDEREYRVMRINKRDSELLTKLGKEGGQFVEVNVNTLIEKIVVPPHTKWWRVEHIKSLLNASQIDIEISRSNLERTLF